MSHTFTKELAHGLNKTVTNKKHYTLIVGHSFSLANETDRDVMTDYFPGIWAISSQKSAMKYAKEYLAEGHTITVSDYDNPQYHKLANKFIKELGLSQPLFEEPKELAPSVVTNGKPSNLAQLKRYLSPGRKIRIVSAMFPDRTRETEVLEAHTNDVVTRKGESGKSWLYFQKASDWSFSNTGATYHTMSREGVMEPVFTIEYKD